MGSISNNDANDEAARDAARPLRVLALEPYAARSHQAFLEGLREHSQHHVELWTLPPRKWKWRMRTASWHFADRLEKEPHWDLLFVSDFLNLAELRGVLPPALTSIPAIAYFHENQLTYPLQEGESRDYHFALAHVHTILASARTLFNSGYHRDQFLGELRPLLKLVPDIDRHSIRQRVAERCAVLPLGCDLPSTPPRTPDGDPDRDSITDPVIVWNHRWEYDKDPDTFVDAVIELARRGAAFQLRVLGESFRVIPEAFERLRHALPDRCEHVGFIESRADYVHSLRTADIVVSSALHEFFGSSALEAIRCGLFPVLPHDLAYPELIPDELHSLFLYPRQGGLVEPLARALTAVTRGEFIPERQQLVAYTERFSWKDLAAEYDHTFREIAALRDPDARS